jgi:hypothetical protein
MGALASAGLDPDSAAFEVRGGGSSMVAARSSFTSDSAPLELDSCSA